MDLEIILDYSGGPREIPGTLKKPRTSTSGGQIKVEKGPERRSVAGLEDGGREP